MHFLIVTPGFNQLDYLKRCIASVRDQVSGGTVAVHHHIQDGGSTDGTVDWLCQYLLEVESGKWNEQYPSYSFSFTSEADEGMYDAVNRGWQQGLGMVAGGRWQGADVGKTNNKFSITNNRDDTIVAWLNCDEQYLEGALLRVAGWFERHPEKDVVFGDALVVRPEGTLLCVRRVCSPKLNHIATAYLPVFSAAMFLRAHAVVEKNLFPDPAWRVLGDVELVARMIKAQLNPGVLHENLAAFTDSGNNYSLTGPAEAEQARMMQKLPLSAQRLKVLWMILHRIKKLIAGDYLRRSVSYALYTGAETTRTPFSVRRAPVIWRGR
jgi:hypothetical protein